LLNYIYDCILFLEINGKMFFLYDRCQPYIRQLSLVNIDRHEGAVHLGLELINIK
jgi:hypothetical protein